LQAQARELEAATPGVADPKELAGAVDMARASLDDALSLSDQLLEAFHEARLHGENAAAETAHDEENPS